MIHAYSRRQFLVNSTTLVASGLVLGFRLEGAPAGSEFAPNAYIHFAEDGTLSFIVHRSEMGQWARTTCVILLAEELRQEPTSIQVIQADGDSKYGDQNTDGSTTVRINWDPLREAGATAREMLIAAAAQLSGLPTTRLSIAAGGVLEVDSKKLWSFKELVSTAAKLSVPKSPKLLSAGSGPYFAIGKDWLHIDSPKIVRGEAVYGMDVDLPGMVYALICREPTRTGRIKALNDKATKALPGVLKVVRLEPALQPVNLGAAVAVIADSLWAAEKGLAALELSWEIPAGTALESTVESRQQLLTTIKKPLKKLSEVGKVPGTAAYPTLLQASYYTPYLVHAPMEPLVAVAQFRDNQLTVWAPHQDPQGVRKAVAGALKLNESQVTIHVTMLGGAFGRKSQPDFVIEAALLAREIPGTAVKVVWKREDEIKHGYYHAESAQYLEARVNKKGEIGSWLHRSHFPSIMSLFAPDNKEHGPFELGMGLTNNPYSFPHRRLEAEVFPTNVRIGWYRAVCENFHSFAVNSFMDEIAAKTSVDPIELRLMHLKESAPATADDPYPFNVDRMRAVVERVRTDSAWTKKKPGIYRGFACHFSFRSYLAAVVEASTGADGKFKITKVYIVADCGIAINPDGIRAQLEGAVIFGLSHTLHGEITVKAGAIEQSNFDDYPVLRIDESPAIQVTIIASKAKPTGSGEPGVPVIAPAVLAAYTQATGKRTYSLPLKLS